MLIPKKTKHRKWQKGRSRFSGVESRGTNLIYGKIGLKAIGRCWLTSVQIEAARKAMTNFLQREGKVWIRVFPDKPISKRPPELTMGGGKGPVDHYAASIKPGRILFEIDGVDIKAATRALKLASHKLPIKTKTITNPSAI